MNSAPLESRQRPASLAPIYAALIALLALGLLALAVASWPSGATRPSAQPHPPTRAPAEHPAGHDAESPPRPAVPTRGGVWTQADWLQGFESRR